MSKKDVFKKLNMKSGISTNLVDYAAEFLKKEGEIMVK